MSSFRSVYNENAELDSAGVEPGAGGFGFYLPDLKIGLLEKRSTQEAAKSVLVFMSNWVSLFLVVASAHPTPNGQIFDKTDMPTGPGAR